METAPLDFISQNERAGFRLHRFEVLNWGTFHQRVWKLETDGHNALVTGDIGSGKSTLVDALTTLLVPPQRITYNEAAGAGTRERTPTSYVRGAYKTEKDDTQFAAKSVFLRNEGTYSVLLGYFLNEGYETGATLAQVFWPKEGKSQPERFYVVANRSLSIAQDFTDFGRNISALKKRFKKEPGLQVFDTFTQYAVEFRRRLAIPGDQALDLFYKTVSMKTIGNLTEFIRGNMLEPPPVKDRIEEICRNFDNLNRAHEAVLKAKNQIHLLAPLVQDCDRLAQVDQHIREFTSYREALLAYFAAQKAILLEEQILRRETEHKKIVDRLNQDTETLTALRRQQEQIQRSIAENGGGRLESLKQEMDRLQEDRARRAAYEEDYKKLCENLKLVRPAGIDSFHENREKAGTLQMEVENERSRQEEKKLNIQVELKESREAVNHLEEELHSLKGRESNIPFQSLELRRRLCETLSLEEVSLPFAGELLQVRSEGTPWEGAIERLLHNFGLSLLVPEEFYSRVSRYVDATHLQGRLVYFRLREEKKLTSDETRDRRLLIHKLDIKPDTRFHDWMEQELARHFNYICSETIEEFQREVKALTKQGQAKSQGRRHEKDDRFRIDDRSRYVLGWTNAAKIKALESRLLQMIREREKQSEEITLLDRRVKELSNVRDAARDLLKVKEFQDIDWRSVARRIAELEEEKKRLLEGSDALRTLQDSLAEVEARITEAEKARGNKDNERAVLVDRLTKDQMTLKEARTDIEKLPEPERQAAFPILDKLRAEALGDKELTVDNCDRRGQEMREWVQAKIDAERKKVDRLVESISQAMLDYKTQYPQETREVDAKIEAQEEFRRMLQGLKEEDLPRHEENFRKLLNERTINDIALFQNQLHKEQRDIRDKIDLINQSLREIEYNSGTYIELMWESSQDREVRQFQQDLKACVENTLTTDEEELYNERKFYEVKKIIDRFNGRIGETEQDRKWMLKVTDVRNWFEFSVVERWQETKEQKEFYSDSSGKSGGQKEKLAYTILASALAYQFGLKWGETRSQSFRFVMIDEAFGRGSDESARYALKLFKELNLQLLIVTPLQKIHVIEDFVRSVHFVHNEDGRCSMIRNLSIEEYREDKVRFQKEQAASALSS